VKQNKYDDPAFFEAYGQLLRSRAGLAGAGEWHAFRALLPDLRGRRVLDLGCGFGWHCRYARKQGARAITGVDLSERMLARAREMTIGSGILYVQCAIEDIQFDPGSFDIVLSSLAFHYVERFDLLAARVHRWLAEEGKFIFSVEHPIFTASQAGQDWWRSPEGQILHWPVDAYQAEGVRSTNWLADNVVKYHRTVATYVNSLLDAGFRLDRLLEPEPDPGLLRDRPDWQDETRRPMFLILAASKDQL
jgi:SAM-dependent methyltransferase